MVKKGSTNSGRGLPSYIIQHLTASVFTRLSPLASLDVSSSSKMDLDFKFINDIT